EVHTDAQGRIKVQFHWQRPDEHPTIGAGLDDKSSCWHTDAQGRIKVQFHWQRPDEHPTIGAGLDDKSSCWLRVAMPSAGAGWGHQFIPRIGQEVLVDFIEGDIDRPVITGVLYNGSHPTPDFSGAGSLPANKTLSGIKS
ncbi:phage baseplate assembly protein V, partial [Chromobacterium piscinae]|uniref:phage baseplate assembly protein V n=1 Tax=Chromobacterium piscinae TaxID=686831 RepID=UPI0031FE1F4C